MTAIRPGNASDLAPVARLQDASPEAARWDPADYLAHHFYVATAGNSVIGFVVFRDIAAGERELLNLAVAPEARRQGVGKALLAPLLEGFSGDVFLEVRKSNFAAQKFYNALNFQQLSVRTNYYQDPPESAIVMKYHSC